MSEPSPDNVESRPVKPRKPWLAAVLSLIATGMGQVYNGQWKKGVGFFVAELVLGLVMIPMFADFTSLAILVAFLVGFNVFVAGEAYATARGVDDFIPGRTNRWWVYAVFIIGGLVLGAAFERVVQCCFYKTYQVPSRSMVPTLQVGDHFMVGILDADDALERGDIVIFKSPKDESVDFVKRVVGLPGETVEMRDWTVFVDGKPLDEPYVFKNLEGPLSVLKNIGPYTVPESAVFVLGDNRGKSTDSRVFGPVPRERVTGRALYIYFPGPGGKGKWIERLGRKLQRPTRIRGW